MVFKRFTDLTDRLISAGSSAATSASNAATNAATHATNAVWYGRDQADKIRELEAMGFSAERARHALNATEGDVDRAAELLLLSGDNENAGGNSGGVATGGSVNTVDHRGNNHAGNENGVGQHVAAHNDEQMRRAIEESLQMNQAEDARLLREAEVASMSNAPAGDKPRAKTNIASAPNKKDTKASKQPAKKQQTPTIRSAAAINAGKAAASRQNNGQTLTTAKTTLDKTHPNVKIPEKLQDKSKEEQILRCADRLKSHVMAVDTLIIVLTSVRNSPDTMKFRTIDRTNGNYVLHVRDKPGAEDMLRAMNYRKVHNKNELRLERHLVDDALLFLGISALEQARESDEYKEAKRWRAFHAEMKRVAKSGGGNPSAMSNGMSEEETAIRVAFLSKCPKEPAEGRGALMHIHLGEEKEKIEGGYICRRFDGDDVLDDVLHWIGGCYGTELLDRIKSREWCLCDLNRYPILPLDVEKHGNKTLQYLGLFPSGKLGVRLSSDSWKSGGDDSNGVIAGVDFIGSARGLGAASRSMLQ